jgi:hypothetical protein
MGRERKAQALFSEVQMFRHHWAWAPILIGCVAVAVGALGFTSISGVSERNPDDGWGAFFAFAALILGLIAFVGTGALLVFARLTTEVREGELTVQFFPFHLSPIRFQPRDLADFEPVTYRPLRDYGGWGLRWGQAGKAYTVKGTRGVMLHLLDGKKLLIGSQHPDQLAAALNTIKNTG